MSNWIETWKLYAIKSNKFHNWFMLIALNVSHSWSKSANYQTDIPSPIPVITFFEIVFNIMEADVIGKTFCDEMMEQKLHLCFNIVNIKRQRTIEAWKVCHQCNLWLTWQSTMRTTELLRDESIFFPTMLWHGLNPALNVKLKYSLYF